MPSLLAFDTATERTYLALEVGGRIWQLDGEGGARASATFLPSVRELLDQAGIAVEALDAIAFGRGPGAFTGLRIASAVAQGLALAARRPVLPIDTLLAVAEDARVTCIEPGGSAPERVWALLDARMGEIYAAQYRHGPGGWQVLDAPALVTPDRLHQRWLEDAPELIAGPALGAYGDRLVTGAARVAPHAVPRATALLRLAHALWQAGGAVDPALALPLYVRDKVAETTAERAARAAA